MAQIGKKKRPTRKQGGKAGRIKGVEIVPLSRLKPAERNARKHPPRQVGMIAEGVREVGAGRSGVIDEDYRLLAGNGTLEAMKRAGIERVKIVDAEPDEWVQVRRKGLSEAAKERLALYDNRTGELSSWDSSVLQEFKAQDLLQGLWNQQEFDKLFPNGQTHVEGELEFGLEHLERADYLMFRFTNELDWTNAVQTFGVKAVKIGSAKDVRTERYGRVLDGAALLKRINDLEDEVERLRLLADTKLNSEGNGIQNEAQN